MKSARTLGLAALANLKRLRYVQRAPCTAPISAAAACTKAADVTDCVECPVRSKCGRLTKDRWSAKAGIGPAWGNDSHGVLSGR